jgi:hypothetical protein
MREKQRHEARMKAREEVAFTFGFFAFMPPVVAVVAGAVGIATGLVTPRAALITVALMSVLLVTMLNDSWRISQLAYRAIVYGTAEVVVQLARVPAARPVAEFLGITVVLWLPIVTLAVVTMVA